MPHASERERNPGAAAPSGQGGAGTEIVHYTDKNGRDYFHEWESGLRDYKAAKALHHRLLRVRSNNFGDCGPLRDGVWELRIDVGPGYRVYYAKTGLTIVLLLCGGDKRSQSRDIDRAVAYWNDWKAQEGEK